MITGKHYSIRLISLVIILSLLLLAIVLSLFFKDNNTSNRVHHHKQGIAGNVPKEQTIFNGQLVDDSFVTHLPLVIIDTHGQELKVDSVWDSEKGYRVPVSYDPYVLGEINIIDNKNGPNGLQSEPSINSDIVIRLRGNSSLGFDKKQYLVKLINENGSKNKQNILGMGENWEWIINISFIDKSLLRNYMCMNIAGEVMPYVPDMRFCELVIREGTKNIYQGVYLIEEKIKQGPGRIDIAQYDPRYPNSGYILRRDRYDEEGIMLNNYGTEYGLTPGYLDIKYPSKSSITNETIKYIEDDVSAFEKALFSDDPNEFFTYSQYIDEQSFVDYFIINEFFANYDAKFHSVYMYKEYGGKISMGPVWDFDHAIDNSRRTQLNTDTTAMHDAPWFRQLLRDGQFVTKLIKRYHELRKTILSDDNIIEYIDHTIEFLGPAQKRDWDRWGYFYTDQYLDYLVDEEGNIIDRNTKTYAQEIDKVKTVLIAHGKWLDDNIESLYQFCEYMGDEKDKNFFYHLSEFVLGTDNDSWIGGAGAILFMLVFIVSIVLVQRE